MMHCTRRNRTPGELPKPTRNQDRVCADIDRWGYGLLEGAFTAANGGINQRVWLLPNKGTEFLEVFELDALHSDQWWALEPPRAGRRNLPVGSMTRTRFDVDPERDGAADMMAPAACSNALIMMDPFSDANGGTRLVPGSHLAGRHPDQVRDANVDTIAAEGPAGTAIITDGRVWHGTGENRTNDDRTAMILTYCGPQYRPQVNYTVALDREILANASDRLKTLFGLKVWWGYGRTENPSVDFIDPSKTALGELRLN